MGQPANDPLEAFQNLLNGTPALVAAYPGGFWLGRVNPKEDFPYLRITEVANVEVVMTNGVSYLDNRYQFSTFARTAAQARALGTLLQKCMRSWAISFVGGQVSGGLVPIGRPGLVEDPKYCRDGSTCWQDFRMFTLHVNPRGN